MDNKKQWDSLFQKLDNMSDEDFACLLEELDAQGEVPFAIGECEREIVVLAIDSKEAGIYNTSSSYNNQSHYEIHISSEMEMAA